MSIEEWKHLLTEWRELAERAHQGHYNASAFYERLFLMLGIPVIVLSALTGGSEVLGILGSQIGGVISLVIAVLAGLQTFLKFSQRAERHRVAGASYGGIRRSIEEVSIVLDDGGDNAREEVHGIKEQLDSLAKECPEIPKRFLK